MMITQPTDQDCTYEVEYTFTGEVGLHERRRKCTKNPLHEGFTPLKTFTRQDLPSGYQTEEIFKVIQAIANMTVRIRALYTSMARPSTFPETDQAYANAELRGCSAMRVGTGFISDVLINNEHNDQNPHIYCPCYNCQRSKNPQKNWGKISIVTAAHVVCQPDEIVHAEIDCFFDNDEDKDAVIVLYGDSMRASTRNPITKMDYSDDYCQFYIITHDIDLCRKLNQYQIYDLLTSDLRIGSSVESFLTVIVSHPHGCPKCISFGEWTWRDTLNGPGEPEKHRYSYNTPTCPGSSGALVWLLETTRGKWQKIYVHSAGKNNGLNISGAVDMFCEFINKQVKCRIS